MTAGFLTLQTFVLTNGDSPSDSASTQLAAAGTREDDGTATRGAPRSDEASDIAQQLTAAAGSDLMSPADEPNPGPSPEEVAAAEAKKKLEAEAAAQKAAEEAAAKKKAEEAAAAEAAKQKAEERSEEPAASRSSGGSSGESSSSPINAQLDRLAQCESGGNYSINTGNGFYGAFQFDARTWRSNGGSGLPHQASEAEQKRVATNLQAARGWQPWPSCSKKLGLR